MMAPCISSNDPTLHSSLGNAQSKSIDGSVPFEIVYPLGNSLPAWGWAGLLDPLGASAFRKGNAVWYRQRDGTYVAAKVDYFCINAVMPCAHAVVLPCTQQLTPVKW